MHVPPVSQASFREPARRRGRGSASHLASARDARPTGDQASCREPARRRGRGSASHLASARDARPTGDQASCREPARRRGRGSASHLASARDARRTGEPGFLPRANSTTRETHLPARCRRRSRSPFLRCRHADLTPSDTFPAVPRVASLAMAPVRNPVSSVGGAHVRALSAHGNATRGVSRGGHLPARCRRRSRSPFLRCRHADLTPSDTFPAVPRVASLAMAPVRKPVSSVGGAHVRALSAHGNATRGVSRGGHLPARCRRRSRSPLLRRRHADPTPPDAFPGCAALRVPRDGSL